MDYPFSIDFTKVNTINYLFYTIWHHYTPFHPFSHQCIRPLRLSISIFPISSNFPERPLHKKRMGHPDATG